MRCKPTNDAPFNFEGAHLGVNSQSFLIKDFNSTGNSREFNALYEGKDFYDSDSKTLGNKKAAPNFIKIGVRPLQQIIYKNYQRMIILVDCCGDCTPLSEHFKMASKNLNSKKRYRASWWTLGKRGQLSYVAKAELAKIKVILKGGINA